MYFICTSYKPEPHFFKRRNSFKASQWWWMWCEKLQLRDLCVRSQWGRRCVTAVWFRERAELRLRAAEAGGACAWQEGTSQSVTLCPPPSSSRLPTCRFHVKLTATFACLLFEKIIIIKRKSTRLSICLQRCDGTTSTSRVDSKVNDS